jgi:hypothetical protein
MVKVPGFPRPVYPPDSGKGSINGPDIEAYKRTCSRAGRWPWQQFDNVYSNGFSHGAGPNVIDTGIAGVQRQQSIEATGWIGELTFNTLRSIRVPDGLPHAGEMAMDSVAATLIAEAWSRFGGYEPAGSGTLRQAALARATGQINYVEGPNNANKYGDWYGANNQPWCSMFLTWCFVLGAIDIGVESQSFVRGSRWAYVPYVVNAAQNGQYGLKVTNDPMPGDLVCYDWNGGDYDHIGIFMSGNPGGWIAVEGNTSTSSNSNGGQVMSRERSPFDVAHVTFVRVNG